jgi:hypothetical protein
MSQLNLKQILSGDNLSSVVDKINYNFDQIVLNGGGPQGLRGIIGAPGLPGLQGLIGETGSTGPEGTHLYAAQGASPGVYPFGTGGEILPRVQDIFIEAGSSYINIWELTATGGSASYWNLVETVTSPSAGWKTVFHSQNFGTPYVDVSNDYTIAEKVFIGDAAAYGTGPNGDSRPYIFSATLGDPSLPDTFNQEFSLSFPYANSLTVLASQSNQLRLVGVGLAGATGALGVTATNNPVASQDRGGIVHSIETSSTSGGSNVQIYRIRNADSVGNKFFSLGLNSSRVSGTSTTFQSPNTLLYGDQRNYAGISIPELAFELGAQLCVGNSIAVGDSNFISAGTSNPIGATLTVIQSGINRYKTGAVIQGNLAVGLNNNTFAKGVFYGSTGSAVWIDTNSAFSATRTSSLFLGANNARPNSGDTTDPNQWGLIANYQTNGIFRYRSLRFTATGRGLTSSSPSSTDPTYNENVMFISLTASGSIANPQVGINTISPTAMFEVGGIYKIGMGEVPTSITPQPSSGNLGSYIGWNMLRSPVNNTNSTQSWSIPTVAATNHGRAIWAASNDGGLNFSFTSGTVSLSDQQVAAQTKMTIENTGALRIHPTAGGTGTYANLFAPTGPGLWLGFGPSGTTGSGQFSENWRRQVAIFGNGPLANNQGSPLICATNGQTQSVSVISSPDGHSVLPQYTFWNADTFGMYFSNGGTGNGTSNFSVGIAAGGTAGITVTQNGARTGIFQRNPLERFQIGDKLVYHDGGSKYLGFNIYYDNAAGENRRIAGSTAPGATMHGWVSLGFPEMGITSIGAVTTRFANLGTNFVVEVGNLGGTASTSSSLHPGFFVTGATSNRTFRGVMISPPLAGPTATHTNFGSHVPQMSIGIPLDSGYVDFGAEPGNNSGKRGTLAIAAQTRIKPSSGGPFGLTIEDNYNLGLYSSEGYPVAAIGVGGGHPTSSLNRTFSLNFIGDSGRVIGEDISILYAESNKLLNNLYQRRAYFGSNFRVGINEVPMVINSPLPAGLANDIAPLVVDAATTSYTVSGTEQSIPQSAIFRGALVLDQTSYSGGNGGNAGLVFKDGTIFSANNGRTTYVSPNQINGDWAIQYYKTQPSDGVADRSGLNFCKLNAGDGNVRLFLDDAGPVGIGTSNFNFQTFWRENYIQTSGYDPASTAPGGVDGYDNGSSAPWNSVSYLYVNPPNNPVSRAGSTVGSAGTVGSGRNFTATLAVSGLIKSVGIFQTSDSRLKTELGRMEEGAAIAKVMKLDPVFYEWKDTQRAEFGFFAQEVKEIVPFAVSTTKSEKFDDEHALDYNSVFTLAIAAIKDQQKTIEKQSETIKNLEDKLSKIEQLLAKHNIS